MTVKHENPLTVIADCGFLFCLIYPFFRFQYLLHRILRLRYTPLSMTIFFHIYVNYFITPKFQNMKKDEKIPSLHIYHAMTMEELSIHFDTTLHSPPSPFRSIYSTHLHTPTVVSSRHQR